MDTTSLAQKSAQDLLVKFYNRLPREKERAIFLYTSRIITTIVKQCVAAEDLKKLEQTLAYVEGLLDGSVSIVDEKGNKITV